MKPSRIRSLFITGMLVAQVGFVIAQESRYFRVAGPVATTITRVTLDGTITWTNTATNATFTVQTAVLSSQGASWADWVLVPASNSITTHRVFDLSPPLGMVLIPAGGFAMGDVFREHNSDEDALHMVYISEFYMDRNELTKALWDEVKAWSDTRGYSYSTQVGTSRGPEYPVGLVTWYDAVKWCNARSEMEGLTPCYYATVNLPYRSGKIEPSVNWNANGYRLPTEAEWEKAARGGASGFRFAWSDDQEIQHARANYYSTNTYAYFDTSPTRGYHPSFDNSTSPVGYFAPNGYGIHDVVGNKIEWCWDWYDPLYYASSASVDPRGPLSGSRRVQRGGAYDNNAMYCRVAARIFNYPHQYSTRIGFRCARTAK